MKNLIKSILLCSLLLALVVSCDKDEEINTQKNYLKVGAKEYPLEQGITFGKGKMGEGYQLYLGLCSSGITYSKESNVGFFRTGSGQLISFRLQSSKEEELDSSDYFFAEYNPEKAVGTFDYSVFQIIYPDPDHVDEIEITGGKISVRKNGSEYSISINCITENGENVTGFYKGTLQYLGNEYEQVEETPDEEINITAVTDTIAIKPVYGDNETFGFTDIHVYTRGMDILGYGVPQIATTMLNFAQAQENEKVIGIAKIQMEVSLPFPKNFKWEINNTRTKIEIEALPDTILFYGYHFRIQDIDFSNPIEDRDPNVAVNKMLLEEGDYQDLYFEIDSIDANPPNNQTPATTVQRYIKRGLKRFFAGNTNHITIYNEKGETRVSSNPDDIDFSKDKKLEIVAEFKIARATATFGKMFHLSDGKLLIPKVKPDHK